ncbi:Hint domain-containing protein [Paracoccus beibuensis]|uniref:Hint domain-containing protein n=1 Tax=Paracoccus beibuensis TaxID=547602 RepID=UPI00223F009E|nr:Hint domain-containing protein [Paracoccus beibuensis]
MSTSNIVATGGADLQLSGGLLNLNALAETNLLIDGNSSITLSSGSLDLLGLNDLLGNTRIAFSGSGDGTFTFNRPSLGVATTSTLNVAEMGPGDQVVIPVAGNTTGALRFGSYSEETGTLRLINGSSLNRVNVDIAMTPEQYAVFNADRTAYLNGAEDTFTFPGDDSSEPPYEAPCFARGTLIATEKGLTAIEKVRVGDEILTRDHAIQPVRWIRSCKLSKLDLLMNPNLRPIRIRAGALGNNTPTADLIVSPQHRVLVRALLRKELEGRTSPFPGRTYPTSSVTGMPSAV